MKSGPSAWAFLRPLLFAVAVAASWIALSAAGAAADSSTSNGPLPGAGAPSLGTASATGAHRVKDVLEPLKTGADGPAVAPASTVPTGVALLPLQPALERVTAQAGGVAQAAPVVNTVVPAAGAVLEPLAPVLEPVIGAVPLPEPTPVAPATPTTTAPALPVVGAPQAGASALPHAAGPEAETAGTAPASARPLQKLLHGTSPAGYPRMTPAGGTQLPPGAGPQDAPLHGLSDALPGLPGAAAGGFSPSGGNGSALPAWLGAHDFQVPAASAVTVRGGRPTAAAPVSFRPGSSPD